MHDPYTQAFEIPWPWSFALKWKRLRASKRRGDKFVHAYVEPMIRIWHHDRNGVDGACGWSHPHLNDSQRQRLKSLAWQEGRDPYFLRVAGRKWPFMRGEAEALYRGLYLQVARYLRVPMTYDEAAKEAALVIHNPDCSDRAGIFCFEPGWHTNIAEDSPARRESHFYEEVANLARWMLASRRPWWRHPRWHVHHWRLQVPAFQALRRRLFGGKHDECCGAVNTAKTEPTS